MITRRINSPFAATFCACIMFSSSAAFGLSVPISVSPSTLNIGSEGTWVTCTVWLPEPYDVTHVVPGTVSLDGIPADSTTGGGSTLTCKFERWIVEAMLAPFAPGQVELTLTGQLTDGNEFEGTDIITVTTDEPVLYTVTATAGIGGSVTPTSASVTHGENVTFTATPEPGWQVAEWSVDGGMVAGAVLSYTLTDIMAPHTVQVTFTQIDYPITTAVSGGGSVVPAGATVHYGEQVAFTATPEPGWQVAEWSVDGDMVAGAVLGYTLTNIMAPHTVQVTFTQIDYPITATVSGGGSVVPASASVHYGEQVAFTATPEPGWQVAEWSVDGGMVAGAVLGYTLTNIMAPHTVQVTLSQIEYPITANAGAGGLVTPTSASVIHGNDLTFTASPDSGFEVVTWFVDETAVQAGGNSFALANIQAAHSVDVTFRQVQFTLTSSSSWETVNGWISPSSPVIVNYGGSQSFTVYPNGGYAVDKWFVDGEEVQTGGITCTLTDIQADHSVHVTFRQVQYTLTTSSSWETVNGWISPIRPVTVNYGDSHLFTAYPNGGYKVETWLVDGEPVQTGGDTYMLRNIDADHKIHVEFRRALAYSLDSIEFDDEEEFDTRVVKNNVIDPDQPEKSLILIERLVGFGADPENGVMLMRNQEVLDPTSADYGQIVHARAKGSFIKADADEILIWFKYLFRTSEPGVELVVYVSDSPELLAWDHPEREQHYIEVARIGAPPPGWPGSVESGRFAVFSKIVWTGHLNFTEGVYVELELVEPGKSGPFLASRMPKGKGLPGMASTDSGDTSVVVDSWSPAVQCYGICLDINWDNFVNEADFLTVVGEVGHTATDELACMDGVFSSDGVLDSLDIVSWDWALNSEERLLNFCGVPLTGGDSVGMMSAAVAHLEGPAARLSAAEPPGELSDLLIVGKKNAMDAASKLRDRLYVFDSDGLYGGSFEPASDRCNIRLLQGPDGEIYQLNAETGLLRLDNTNEVILPPGKIELTDINEPRYDRSATVYLGIQGEGPDLFGRPILDAASDADYVYVVPVVVDPDGGEPYTAAAKLMLLDEGDPPYELVKLYDDPPLPNDNQYRDSLREIELDSAGNLYVLNVHSLNESDILW
ncbi:MAG: InlB B-repeat-containing protein, partial [Planctomycetota bacterium]